MVVAGVVALLAGILLGKYFKLTHQAPTVLSLSAQRCDLNDSTCQIRHADIAVELSLLPQPVPLLKPIIIQGAVQGIAEIHRVHLEITGVNMDMGIQVVPLVIAPDSDHLTGHFQLPVCSTKAMRWQAMLVIQTADGSYLFSFPFGTYLP